MAAAGAGHLGAAVPEQRERLTALGVQGATLPVTAAAPAELPPAPADVVKGLKKAGSKAEAAFQRGLAALAQWVEKEGQRSVPRGAVVEIAVDGEAEPVPVKLGVWLSNTKSRRDKLTSEQRAHSRRWAWTGQARCRPSRPPRSRPPRSPRHRRRRSGELGLETVGGGGAVAEVHLAQAFGGDGACGAVTARYQLIHPASRCSSAAASSLSRASVRGRRECAE